MEEIDTDINIHDYGTISLDVKEGRRSSLEDFVLLKDHKAVVEKYKKNDQKMVDIIVEQQNKIEELEKRNKDLQNCFSCDNSYELDFHCDEDCSHCSPSEVDCWIAKELE